MPFLPAMPLALRRGLQVVVTVLGLACASSGANMREVAHKDFWGGLAELRPDVAAGFAKTPAQREFANALADMLAGRMSAAETEFRELQASADDSLLKTGARVAYSAVLQYEEKWPELAVLPPLAGQGGVDLAGIESWAASFRTVPRKMFAFPGRTVLLPLHLSSAGTPMIPVRVDGKEFHFWLDTGSSLTIVASNVAEALKLRPITGDTLQMVSATGRVRALAALIDRIDLGEIVIRNAPAMIVNDRQMEMREVPHSDEPPAKIDGIIGFDIIHSLDIEVDYTAGRVRLRDPDERKGQTSADRNFFWLGVPVVRMLSSNGTPLHFGLDTGAQQTFGTESLFDRLDIHADRDEARRLGGLAGVASLQAAILHRLDVTVRGQPLYLRELMVYAPVYRTLVSLDGVLGSDVLRLGVVRMDATNGIFSLNEGLRKPVI